MEFNLDLKSYYKLVELHELIDSIFNREIKNQTIRYDKHKRHIDVAKPIHYLELSHKLIK
jgi:hypothetical protein